jgi:hypothetical protein
MARKHRAASSAPNVHPATLSVAKAATGVSVASAAVQSVLKTAIAQPLASAANRALKAAMSVVLIAIAARMRTSVTTRLPVTLI